MNASKVDHLSDGVNHKEYVNNAMATVGDAVLKTIIADHLYVQCKRMCEITDIKKEMENNMSLFDISNSLSLYKFAYNLTLTEASADRF